MKKTINFNDFCDEFRGIRNNFSIEGKRALYDYLLEIEEEQDQEIELDVVALDCEYIEYNDLAEFHESYDKEEYPDIETIQEHTTVLKINDDAFIIAQF